MTPLKRKKKTKPDELSERQQTLVREYALCCDREEAERRAGYAAGHGNAHRILNDPRAQALLKAHVKKADQLAEVHLAWTLANLKRIAKVNIHGLLMFDPNGNFQGLDLKKLDAEQAYAISEIGFDSDGRPKIKFHDKVVANRLIKDYLAPDKPQRVRLEGPSGGPVEIIEGLGARLNAARQRAKERRSGSRAA